MRDYKYVDRKHPSAKALIAFVWLTGFALFNPLVNQDVVAQNSQGKRFRVTIDPGHGGKDAGESGLKSIEKDITLKIALKLGSYLTSQVENVDVYFTRTTDDFVPLDQRSRLATDSLSDLFISIHLGADKDSSIIGASSYVLGSSRTTQSTLHAIQENKSILLEPDYETRYPGMDPLNPGSYSHRNSITVDRINQLTELAEAVQNRLQSHANRNDLGTRPGNFIVLWDCPMPSILIKAGYLTNPEEEEFLMSENGQDMIATALFMAIRDFGKLSVNTSIPQTQDVKSDTKIARPDSIVARLPDVKKESASNTQQKVISEVYAIQVAATKSYRAPADFKEKYNLPDSVYWFTRDNWYKYVTGRFSTQEEAEKYKAQHKISGFVTTVPEK